MQITQLLLHIAELPHPFFVSIMNTSVPLQQLAQLVLDAALHGLSAQGPVVQFVIQAYAQLVQGIHGNTALVAAKNQRQ